MGKLFEELDSQATPIGEISLRRRRIPALTAEDIYEVKLNDEFLMSSLFVKAEEALADLGLAALEGESLQVVVGGLGLGHTAAAALTDKRVEKLWVVELLQPVIDWHQRGLVPLDKTLSDDSRCEFVQGSFFDLALDKQPGLSGTGKPLDAILLDIDHSPSEWLHDTNASFYTADKLAIMAQQLTPGGVFAMWSNDPEDPQFMAVLQSAFAQVSTHTIRFYNPFQNREATATVYVALTG